MPLPTTRYARFVYRQRRYRRRYEIWRRNRPRVEQVGPPVVMGRRHDSTRKGNGSQQLPHGLKRRPWGHSGLPVPIGFPMHFHFFPAEHYKPPRMAIHRNVTHALYYGKTRPWFAVSGYFVKRSKWFGRKLNPKTDGKRKPRAIKYALRLFALSGEWPIWAPVEWMPVEG